MNWLFPGFLAGAALIACPVILHFLRRRKNVVVRFPSLRFLGETALRDTRRHQLRRWLTLLLRCLAIALIAGAFARPFFAGHSASRRHSMVIAVDNSMSMQSAGRWEKLRDWAGTQLDELAPGDRAAVLIMNPSPSWLVPMTDDLAAVRTAMKEIEPGFEKTRYDAALRVGGEVLARELAGSKTLVWMADEQRIGWVGADLKETLPPGVRFRMAEIPPAPARQAAIVSVQKTSAPEGLSVLVRQFQPAGPDTRQITVRSEKQVLYNGSVSLHAGDNKIDFAVTWPPNTPGLRISLDPDDLPADDTAWIVTDKPVATTVLLDKVEGADFVSHALISTEKLNEGALKPSPLPNGPWPVQSVAIVRSGELFRTPHLERLNAFFDGGGSMWIFVDGSPGQKDWLEKHGVRISPRRTESEPWHLRDWDPEHPALAAFEGQSLLPLLEVEFHNGFDLTGDQLTAIANWPDGKPALVEWSAHGHRLLIAGFPASNTSMNWPAQPSFVPFVHRTVRWLGSVSGARNEWRVGEKILLPSEPGTWRLLDGIWPQPQRTVTGSVRATAPGLYEFARGGVRQVFAVNTAPEESELASWPQPAQLAALESKELSPIRAAQSAATLSDTTAENQQRLWWWAIAVCGVILLAELALSNRTAL